MRRNRRESRTAATVWSGLGEFRCAGILNRHIQPIRAPSIAVLPLKKGSTGEQNESGLRQAGHEQGAYVARAFRLLWFGSAQRRSVSGLRWMLLGVAALTVLSATLGAAMQPIARFVLGPLDGRHRAGSDRVDGGDITDRINYTDRNTLTYSDSTSAVKIDLTGIGGDGALGTAG